MQGSERWDVLAVGYLRTNWDWGRGSMRVGTGAVVGQRGHHRHDDDNDIVVLHGAGRAPLWAPRQSLIWGWQVQVWVQAGAPVHWHWDNGDVAIAFVVDEGGSPWGCYIGTGR